MVKPFDFKIFLERLRQIAEVNPLIHQSSNFTNNISMDEVESKNKERI